MNPLRHIVHALPRHAPPSNPISGGASSGYHIHARSILRGGADFLPRGPRSRSCAGCGGKNHAQTLSLARQTHTLTRCRNASADRVGNSNVPFPNTTGSDDKKTSKAKAPTQNENQAPRLMPVPEPRKYAKLIADYSAAIERQSLDSKSKELPIGLLSRLPIESLVSSWRPFERRPRSKLAKRSSISMAANLNADQSRHALTKNVLKNESSKSLGTAKNAPQKRDYFTKNHDSDQFFNAGEQSRGSNSKVADAQSQRAKLMKSAYVPNDFDVFCDLTEKHNPESNYAEWSHSGGIDHKVKAPGNLVHDFELLNPNSDNDQCQFHIVASKEKIELQPSSSASNASSANQEKSNRTHSHDNKGLPWWAIPESTLDEKYEKAEGTSTPEIKVIYSEEMPGFEVERRNEESPSLSNKSKSKRPEKLANISKTKQYIKEELEKQKNKQKKRKSVDKLTNIDGGEADEGERGPTNERSDDKTAKSSKMMDLGAASEKTENASAIAEARRGVRKRARKSTIDQGYRMKRVTEPLKPLEKRKDGTLIDYGLKVPTRRPKKQQPLPGEPRPEKKKSSAADLPRKITACTSQQSLLDAPRKSGENCKNNSGAEPRTSNCAGISADGLADGPGCEQMFGQPPRAGCRCDRRPCTCALESARSAERPEKRLIYSAWLNKPHRAPGLLL